MIGRAACRGAATIVNAIPTGRGAAFGITLETDAEVRILGDGGAFRFTGPSDGADLAQRCVRPVLRDAGLEGRDVAVRVESEIPVSRGLKSSSAASNALVLAATIAAGAAVDDMSVVNAGVDASIWAGVTVTGAFDDAAACYMGGAVVTDNGKRCVLARGRVDPSLSVLIHVPERRISKSHVKGLDFGPAKQRSEEALRMALAGDYAKALELNSRACSEVLGLGEEVAEAARAKGAVAAGVSGTGPATVVLARRADEAAIAAALERRGDGKVLRASVNDVPAPEVVPRLF
jgi:shikimate kinase